MVHAHVPNTGSMKTCWGENWKVLVSKNDDPKRKMKYTLQSSTLALLVSVCLGSSLAFVPAASNTNPFGVKNTQLDMAEELKLDTDFDNVEIVRLLGLRRMQKFVKKRQSIAKAIAAKEAAAKIEPTPAAVVISAKKPGLKLIIAGAPASGKGTQCEIIKKEYGVVHLSTGDMLRAAVAEGTEVGKQAKAFMDAGKLVPDEVIIGVVSSEYCNIVLHVVYCMLYVACCMLHVV
jgi:adenylate kinase